MINFENIEGYKNTRRIGNFPYNVYTRLCVQCNKMYKTSQRHSKICINCKSKNILMRTKKVTQNDKKIIN